MFTRMFTRMFTSKTLPREFSIEKNSRVVSKVEAKAWSLVSAARFLGKEEDAAEADVTTVRGFWSFFFFFNGEIWENPWKLDVDFGCFCTVHFCTLDGQILLPRKWDFVVNNNNYWL